VPEKCSRSKFLLDKVHYANGTSLLVDTDGVARGANALCARGKIFRLNMLVTHMRRDPCWEVKDSRLAAYVYLKTVPPDKHGRTQEVRFYVSTKVWLIPKHLREQVKELKAIVVKNLQGESGWYIPFWHKKSPTDLARALVRWL
jgi:hypothetical protein